MTGASTRYDATLLDDPVARALLQSTNLARLAYTWMDGTARVVPIWFHWTGLELTVGTPAAAPKVRALRANPRVAITIDGAEFPYKALLIRGDARIHVESGLTNDYSAAALRYLGEDAGAAWLAQAAPLITPMAHIAIRTVGWRLWTSSRGFLARSPVASVLQANA